MTKFPFIAFYEYDIINAIEQPLQALQRRVKTVAFKSIETVCVNLLN